MDIPESDKQFLESIVESVSERDADYVITHNGSWVFSCPKVEGLAPPMAGDTVRLYSRGVGFPVRGIVVGGRVYRYEPAP